MNENCLKIEESSIERHNRSSKLPNIKAPEEPAAFKLTYKSRKR